MTGRVVPESVVEEAGLAWLEATCWHVAHGPDIAPDMPAAERPGCRELMLAGRPSWRLGS